MLEQIAELEDAESTDDLAARLGRFLGLEGPAARAVTRRAIVDNRYCHYLVTSRHRPDTLGPLLADPKNRQYEDTDDGGGEAAAKSSFGLIWKAGKAMARWGAAGFPKIDRVERERRFAACQRCDQLVEPPERLVYKIRLDAKSDQRICRACGCVALRKTRLATERCPLEDPSRSGFNRWGQPFPAPT